MSRLSIVGTRGFCLSLSYLHQGYRHDTNMSLKNLNTSHLLLLLLLITSISSTQTHEFNGTELISRGTALFLEENYVEAAIYIWASILHRNAAKDRYKIVDAYQSFLKCFNLADGWDLSDGYAYIASEYQQRGSWEQAKENAEHALTINGENRVAKAMLFKPEKQKRDSKHTPEEYYEKGLVAFETKDTMEKAAKYFERACIRSGGKLNLACTNAVFCRTNAAWWGADGEQYRIDLELVEEISREESLHSRVLDEEGKLVWLKPMSVHPHMMLGYPLRDVSLKRLVAESHAQTDLAYGVADAVGHDRWKEEIDNFSVDTRRQLRWNKRKAKEPNFKIRIGYISSGFNSKAVLFLAQDILRYHKTNKFEVHVLSIGEPDNPLFIEKVMRGVDWRKRVESYVDYFHDIQEELKGGPIALAKYIIEEDIHILVDWDGYCRNGIRAQGLFALRPAPIQIMHQEFLGTSGGNYDYLVTDAIVSPLNLEHLYDEKFIYMPYHFFAKGHAVQDEVIPPQYDYTPRRKRDPYVLGTGTPQQNQCGKWNEDLGDVSFVFCNFNKFLKFSPETVLIWLKVLEKVPDSILCLLENPREGVKHLKRFVKQNSPELADRVHFLEWENNPFDHQRRNRDFCNLILDCHPYNGHTTTMDALYAGVPVVTRSDGQEMSSLVTTSANINLGITECNAESGLYEYRDIAIHLATTPSLYNSIRRRLIDSTNTTNTNSLHPFWDMKRYTRNLEQGLEKAWDVYLNEEPLNHITVFDDYEEEEENDIWNYKMEDEDEDDGMSRGYDEF